jgi:asparagine synthase (glutamine-hydrolysing)
MWGLLPEMVLTNTKSGAHAVDWHEKLSRQRDRLAQELPELSASILARRSIDFARLDRAINNWPTGAWHTSRVADEYHYALSRAVAGARFLRWFESANR